MDKANTLKLAVEKIPEFSCTVKDTAKTVDHLMFKAIHLDKATGWKVEIHDSSWPHTKSVTYSATRGAGPEANWNTIQCRLKPRKLDRMVAWRAKHVAGPVEGSWTAWKPVSPANERITALENGNANWGNIFEPLRAKLEEEDTAQAA